MKSLENLTINDYVSIIKRRVWYVIVTTILAGIATVISVKRLPPVYKSETTVQIVSRLLPEDYIRSLDRQTGNERIDFVREQIQSRSFLEQIVREFQLSNGGVDSVEKAAGAVRNNIEITVLSPSSFKLGFRATKPTLAQAVARRLAERVIQLNDSSRKEKVQVADQFLDEQQREAANQLSQTEEKFYQFRKEHFPGMGQEGATADGLRDLQSQLTIIENRLDNATNERKALGQRLEEQRQLRVVMTATAPEAQAPVLPPAPSPLEAGLSQKRAELAAASTRYTALHPEVLRLKQEIQELENLVAQARSIKPPAPPTESHEEDRKDALVLPQLESADLLQAEASIEADRINGEISKLEQNRKELVSKIALYQIRLNPPPAVAQELASLTREYDTAKQTYTYLSDRKLNSAMAARVDASDDNETFRISDAAFLPQFPVSTDHTVLAAGGCLAGFLLGLGLAFLRDYLDPSLQDEDAAATELKVPVLASIPFVGAKRNKKEAVRKRTLTLVSPNKDAAGTGRQFQLEAASLHLKSVILDPVTIAGEHFRLMRARLSMLQKQKGYKSILVSSAIPNDGKTFVACCLAGILAQEPGKKVLLIDADLRTASAGKSLGFTREAAGLSEMLRGSAILAKLRQSDIEGLPPSVDLEKSLWKCADVNMYFLPSGALVDNPTDLLSSNELERLLRQAERVFDWVIVDAPPVLGLADANLVLHITDSTLLVVNARRTPAALVKDAIQKIGAERICGVLMNQVRTIRSSKYYGQYQEASRLSKST